MAVLNKFEHAESRAERIEEVLQLLSNIAAETRFTDDDGSFELGERLLNIEKIVYQAVDDIAKAFSLPEKMFEPVRDRPDRIFVFGSNLAGYHGAGAAYEAVRLWGAKMTVGFGPTGQSYAIPTKDKDIQTLPLTRIAVYTGEFASYASKHPELTFLVTRIGCGLAGYTDEEMAPLFKDCIYLSNVVLPYGWGGRNIE